MNSELHDSGQHQSFETGARRDTNTGKGRYSLISVLALKRLAVHLEKGSIKYEARNWEKGIPLERSYTSLMRHLTQWMNGERDEDHLAAVLCNAMFLIHTEAKIREGTLPVGLLVDMSPEYIAAWEAR